MYIRFKKEFADKALNSKWVRISHRKWTSPSYDGIRHMYEIKDQSSQSPAQLEALAIGRVLRHVHAAVAQASLALQYLSELSPHLKASMEAMIVQEEGKHYPTAYKDFGGTRASISLANSFAFEALTSLKQLTKKGAALKQNKINRSM